MSKHSVQRHPLSGIASSVRSLKIEQENKLGSLFKGKGSKICSLLNVDIHDLGYQVEHETVVVVLGHQVEQSEVVEPAITSMLPNFPNFYFLSNVQISV